jgi:GTPase
METNKRTTFRCGMVSIVGRPNVGKSTLLNRILGEKVAIVSRVPQTTRNQIRGIYNDERGQIIFIDTPGYHLGKDKLDQFMNKSSTGSMQEVDCLIYLVDTSRRIGEEEENIVNKLKAVKVPIILGLNKVDLKSAANLPAYISLWEQAKGQPVTKMKSFTLLPLSAKEGINIDKLLNILFGYLPKGPALYPVDIICDVPQKMAIADIIREKLLRIMRDEVPHALGVVIEHIQPKQKKTLHIRALIIVERDAHKEIVIGKNGQVLKKAGTAARIELEELLESKIFLELHVKTQKRWRDNVSLLQELGYSSP